MQCSHSNLQYQLVVAMLVLSNPSAAKGSLNAPTLRVGKWELGTGQCGVGATVRKGGGGGGRTTVAVSSDARMEIKSLT